jgi:hypothetical protein
LQRPVIISEARCNCSHGPIVVQDGAEVSDGTWGKMRVGVDRENIPFRKEFDTVVDGSPVTEIRGSVRDQNSWPSSAHVLRRAVGRTVVDDCDGHLCAVLRQKARDACIEPLLAVIAWDDCRDESARARFDDPF